MTAPPPRPRRAKPATPEPAAPKVASPATRRKAASGQAAATSPTEAKGRRPRTKAGAPTPAPAEPALAPRRRTIWLSGATGFVGKSLARVLRTRGDDVIAPVRDPRKALDLIDMGVTVIEDDLSDVRLMTEQLRDVDAAVHAAGSYRVGIDREERGAMWDANIGTTTRVLDAAEAAKTPHVVYVSTVGVYGNTHGRVVDETYHRDVREGFTSWYDETKFGAHEVAAQRARAGAPVTFVLPSQVYGPDDHSAVGEQIRLAYAGKLPYRLLDEVGLGFVHVDDLAVGIAAALDRGAPNRAYVLSGPTHRLGEVLAIAARLGGKALPRMRIPTVVLRALAPIGPRIGQPNLREVVAAGAGVTHWASNERARRELGFEPREVEVGLKDTFEAMLDRAYTRS